MDKPQDPEAAENVKTTSLPAVDLPRLVDGGLCTTALFGSSDWRAEGWEDAMKSAKTGDRYTGQQRDGSWIAVTVRVLEGTMEGRHQIRFVYVGWEKNSQHCESTFECFATMHRRIESLPNDQAMASADEKTPTKESTL